METTKPPIGKALKEQERREEDWPPTVTLQIHKINAFQLTEKKELSTSKTILKKVSKAYHTNVMWYGRRYRIVSPYSSFFKMLPILGHMIQD